MFNYKTVMQWNSETGTVPLYPVAQTVWFTFIYKQAELIVNPDVLNKKRKFGFQFNHVFWFRESEICHFLMWIEGSDLQCSGVLEWSIRKIRHIEITTLIVVASSLPTPDQSKSKID